MRFWNMASILLRPASLEGETNYGTLSMSTTWIHQQYVSCLHCKILRARTKPTSMLWILPTSGGTSTDHYIQSESCACAEPVAREHY